MSRAASILFSLVVALALTIGAVVPAWAAAEACLDGSRLAEVRPGTSVADKTGRWVGRVESVHCRRGFRDAQLFVRVGRLRDDNMKIIPARTARMVGTAVVVPLTKAQIHAKPSHALPNREG